MFLLHHFVLKVKLCAIDEKLVESWKDEFKPYPEVDIIEEDIFRQTADAIVSPGNSFGLMDAGLDKLMCDYFGKDLENQLQGKIRGDHYGELPVGTATILQVDDRNFSYFISSPTMRVPMRLKESVNVYLATRAVFLTIDEFNDETHHIGSVVIPGMGVGSGKMPYEVAAKQMRVAYESIILGKLEFPQDWKVAREAHNNLKTTT